jgi:hypothetical protein
MPKFRFETTAYGQTTAFEEELASADLASPRAIENARAAMVADAGAGKDQSGSITKSMMRLDIWSRQSIFQTCCRVTRTPSSMGLATPPSKNQV